MLKAKRSSPSAPVGAVLILAAGLGKRMKSDLPKVLHEVCGEPMLVHLLRSVAESHRRRGVEGRLSVGIIVGHGREHVESAVRAALTGDDSLASIEVSFLLQSEQKGTGHAVRSAMGTEWGNSRIAEKSPILVLPGDSPLIPESLVSEMLLPLRKGASVRLLTCRVPDPKGYGRILRQGMKPQGSVLRIVEEKDANERERLIQEVAASTYLFDSSFLSKQLPKLTTKNAQGEYYLTDLIEAAARLGTKGKGTSGVSTLEWANSEDLRGVNDLWELAIAEKILQMRIIERHARNGVRFLDPFSVALENGVKIGNGVRIHRGVVLRGKTTIGDGVDIGSNTVLRDMKVENGVSFKAGCYCESSIVREGATLGPYAHLRPESVVGKKSKIGNFVELKKTTIGEATSVAHLSYLGDAEVGDRVNIGCGFVTCNFDGRVKNGSRKHKTVIGNDCFIGSDSQTIAPVQIGDGAYVASGSTITRDVASGDLAIARSRQENKAGYAKKLRRE